LHVDIDGEEILLCRHKDNDHAIAYYCSHEEFTLEGGSIRNNCITCPYHGAEFSIIDGAVLAAPAFEPIRIYPLKVTDDETIAICTDTDA